MFKSYHEDRNEDLRGNDSGIRAMVRLPKTAFGRERCRSDHGAEQILQPDRALGRKVPGLEKADE